MKNQNEMRCAWMIGYDLWFNCQNEKQAWSGANTPKKIKIKIKMIFQF